MSFASKSDVQGLEANCGSASGTSEELFRGFGGLGYMKTLLPHIISLVVFGALSANVACSKDAAVPTKAEIQLLVSQELPVGASASEIEDFFKRHDISFAWDNFTGKYVGIIRSVEPFHSITVDFFVDDRRRFARAEINDSYTAP
jgi:hypothetical protein